MRVASYNSQYKYRYNNNKPLTFTGFKVQSFEEFMGISADEFVKNGHKIIDDITETIEENLTKKPFNQKKFDVVQELYMKFQRENEQIFKDALKPEIVEIAQRITDLPTYGNYLLPYFMLLAR